MRMRADPDDVAPNSASPFLDLWQRHKTINLRLLPALEEHANVRLHPRPALGLLVYPCCMHEVKVSHQSIRASANELVKSLVFALDQQEELRRLAGAPEEERMPVFGAASSAAHVNLYCAAYVGETIVSASRRPHATVPNSLTELSSSSPANRQPAQIHGNANTLSRVRVPHFHKGSPLMDALDIRHQNHHLA